MPIVDVQVVYKRVGQIRSVSAEALANALGDVFGSAPGHTWVRTHAILDAAYAENGVRLKGSELPAFVTVLHTHPPVGEALAAEVRAVTAAVAKCIARPISRVHVQYAPPGAGRQAFGGKLVE